MADIFNSMGNCIVGKLKKQPFDNMQEQIAAAYSEKSVARQKSWSLIYIYI